MLELHETREGLRSTLLNQIVDAFERTWYAGREPELNEYVTGAGAERRVLLTELVAVDLKWRLRLGEPARVEHYLERYPELKQPFEVALLARVELTQRRRREPALPPADFYQRLPQFEEHLRSALSDLPNQLGRYRIVGRVGSGAFGMVYRAYDDELERDVAIKVAHRRCAVDWDDAHSCLKEARAVAGLDHPNIVPVFAAGRTENGRYYVVSRFIQGVNLSQKIDESSLTFMETAHLVATVAEALHHAHRRGWVHRDVKPENIMVDELGTPYLTDFGLALRDDDRGNGTGVCGTPAYMSPEQASGDESQIDGRSDIFSLGAVLYELLTGRLPFRAERRQFTVRFVRDTVCPPRQIDERVPRALERVCLRALSLRISDRYTTAWEMANDLRHFLARPS